MFELFLVFDWSYDRFIQFFNKQMFIEHHPWTVGIQQWTKIDVVSVLTELSLVAEEHESDILSLSQICSHSGEERYLVQEYNTSSSVQRSSAFKEVLSILIFLGMSPCACQKKYMYYE